MDAPRPAAKSPSFLTRTPQTVLPISNCSSRAHLVKALLGASRDDNGLRCLRVEGCTVTHSEQVPVEADKLVRILGSITKIVVTRCNEAAVEFVLSLLPDRSAVAEVELFNTGLTHLPEGLAHKCRSISHLSLANNTITRIDVHLLQLVQLRTLNILDNPIATINRAAYIYMLKQVTDLQFEIRLNLLHTTSLAIDPPEEPSPSLPLQPASECEVIDLRESILTIIQNTDSSRRYMLEEQLTQIAMAQHQHYLLYMREAFDYGICLRLIQACFRARKYAILNVLMNIYDQIQAERVMPLGEISVGNLRLEVRKESSREGSKQDQLLMATDQNIRPKLAGLIRPKKLTEIAKTTRSILKAEIATPKEGAKNKKNRLALNSRVSRDSGCTRAELPSPTNEVQNVRMYRLACFSAQQLRQLPPAQLKQVQLNNLIFVLNELQFVKTSNHNLHELFSSPEFSKIVDANIADENSLENVFACVGFKEAIVRLLVQTSVKFLKTYHWRNPYILRNICSMDSIELVRALLTRYPQFEQALFDRNLRVFHETTRNTHRQESVKTIDMTLLKVCSSGPRFRKEEESGLSGCQVWRKVLRPHFKLYKYLYKRYKLYLRGRLNSSNVKNLYFPQYKSIEYVENSEVRNQNKILDEYEKFQSNAYRHQQGLAINSNRSSNLDKKPIISLSKKIYINVLDKTNNSIRSLGKSLNKNKSAHTKQRRTLKKPAEQASFMSSRNFCNQTQLSNQQLGPVRQLQTRQSLFLRTKCQKSEDSLLQKQVDNFCRSKRSGISVFSNSVNGSPMNSRPKNEASLSKNKRICIKSIAMHAKPKSERKTIYLSINRSMINRAQNSLIEPSMHSYSQLEQP